jgi:hypothetical protein
VKATIPVALQPGTKLLRLERIAHKYAATRPDGSPCYELRLDGAWKLWLHHDTQMQHGTYLLLHDNGTIENVTDLPDGTERRFWVLK